MHRQSGVSRWESSGALFSGAPPVRFPRANRRRRREAPLTRCDKMARSRKTHIHAPATSEAQPEPSDGLRAGPGSRPVSGGVFSRRAALYSGLFIVRARGPVFGANTATDREAGTRKGGRRPRAGAGGDPPRGGGGGKATKGARQKLTGLGAKRPPSLPTPPASARGAHPPASLHFIALYLWLFGRTVLAGALTRSGAGAERLSSCPGRGTHAERGRRGAPVLRGLPCH